MRFNELGFGSAKRTASGCKWQTVCFHRFYHPINYIFWNSNKYIIQVLPPLNNYGQIIEPYSFMVSMPMFTRVSLLRWFHNAHNRTVLELSWLLIWEQMAIAYICLSWIFSKKRNHRLSKRTVPENRSFVFMPLWRYPIFNVAKWFSSLKIEFSDTLTLIRLN